MAGSTPASVSPARASVLRPDANAGAVALATGGGTGIGAATAIELRPQPPTTSYA